MLRACLNTEMDIEGWLRRVDRPIFDSSAYSAKREGNVNGPLFGETVLFTGALGIPRRRAADVAAESGCQVVNGVSTKVTMLVVGIQDETKLNGYLKSSKHRKVEELVKKGADIQILSEDDFSALMDVDLSSSA